MPGSSNDFLLSEVAQNNLSVSYDYYDAGHKWGLLNHVVDENADATTYDYDSFRRLASVTTPLGETTTLSYHQETFPHFIITTTDLDDTRDVVTTAFFDGLGRPILTQLDEGNSYILTKTDYDALGLPAKTWKPYQDDQPGQYDEQEAETDYNELPNCNDSVPYVETSYLPDPLNRVAATTPAYCDNNDHAITNRYGVANYGAGPRLYVETTDEDTKTTRVYADAFGNQVRTVAGVGSEDSTITEMSYDILGNLVKVLPPNAFAPGADPDDWKTTYGYDARSQLIAKTTPDTDETFAYQYDAKGNLRFVNDPNHIDPTGSGFLYTRYDDFDRVVETGVYVGSTAFTLADADDANWPSTEVEEVVSYTYDDDPPDQQPHPLMTFRNPKGHLKEVVFDGGYSHYNYDDVGRVLEFYTSLDNLGGKLIKYSYDRLGNLKSLHYQDQESDEFELTYTYDDVGRLQKVESQTNDDPSPVQEAFYTYTPTGQVESLQLGANPGAISTIDYTYHIRDWLIQINDPDALGSNQFAMRLGYDVPAFSGAPTYRNGNVGSVVWAGKDSSGTSRVLGQDSGGALLYQAGFGFTYDVLNRLLDAKAKLPGSPNWEDDANYHVSPIEYDPNGNITRLRRNYGAGNSHDLNYTYGASNRLLKVEGLPGTSQPVTFDYDPNGNMTKSRVADPIIYDRRNLPTQMTLDGKGLTFRYDADGQRIYKKLVDGSGQTETFYLRGVDGSVLAVYIDHGSGLKLQYWNILSGGAVIGRIVPASDAN